ncbi:glycoside hydrolase domain-containing protein [Streptomyces monashensis]|uniref:glycoside hydrolase domain-containing protein n=1 Tax=Streptomyces monashensis TaxID=1678012 RepID=UPI0033EAC7A8
MLATIAAVTVGAGVGLGLDLGNPSAAAAATGLGLDFNTYPNPSPSTISADGYTFVCQYLAGPGALTRSSAQAFIDAGIDVLSNWEMAQHAPRNGYSQGVSDAQKAQSAAAAAGMPAARPIYFSLDWDVQSGDLPAIEAYFDGIATVIGRDCTGAYGGYYAIQQLFNNSKITWGWQTYAWSGGNWDSRAQLRQIRNDIKVGGTAVDEDQAVADDFGQWGRPVTSVNTSSQVVAIGNDGHIYHEVRSGGGAWSGFKPMSGYAGAGTFTASSVAVAGMPGGSSQVVAVGNDGKVYHNIRHVDGTWQGWRPLGFAAKQVSIAAMPNGSAQVLAEAPDGTLYHNIRFTPSGTWQGWRALAGFEGAATFKAGSAAIAGLPDGSSQVVAVGNDGKMYHNIRHADGTWQGWRPLGFAAGSVAVAGMPAGGSAQFVAVGNDGTTYHNIRRADGTWQGWRSLGFAAKQVSIAASADGSAQVLVEAPNGTVYHNIRYTPSGNWQGFRPLTGYGAPTFVAGGIGIGGFPY